MPWPPDTHQDVEDAVNGLFNFSLPVGRYMGLTGSLNSAQNLVKSTELSFPFFVPGLGRLDALGFHLDTLSADADAIIRLGIRADNGAVPGAVLAETSIPASAAGGGSVGKKFMTIDIPCGDIYWLSLCAQTSGTSMPRVFDAGQDRAALGGAFFLGPLASSRTSADWATGHSPLASVATNASSTLAAGPVPTGPNVNTYVTGACPAFYVRRGS